MSQTEDYGRHRLLSLRDASSVLGISPRGLYRLYRRGDIVAVRVGHLIKFHWDDLDAYVDGRRERGRADAGRNRAA